MVSTSSARASKLPGRGGAADLDRFLDLHLLYIFQHLSVFVSIGICQYLTNSTNTEKTMLSIKIVGIWLCVAES